MELTDFRVDCERVLTTCSTLTDNPIPGFSSWLATPNFSLATQGATAPKTHSESDICAEFRTILYLLTFVMSMNNNQAYPGLTSLKKSEQEYHGVLEPGRQTALNIVLHAVTTILVQDHEAVAVAAVEPLPSQL